MSSFPVATPEHRPNPTNGKGQRNSLVGKSDYDDHGAGYEDHDDQATIHHMQGQANFQFYNSEYLVCCIAEMFSSIGQYALTGIFL